MADLHGAAMRAAHGAGALDLALGETLLRLFEGDGLVKLGCSRRADYARERLGLKGREMHRLTRLASGLAQRAVLKRSVMCGAVSTNKALAVMGAAHGRHEASWTAAAMHMTLGELQDRLEQSGHDPSADTFEVESIVLRMTEGEQDRLDAALDLAGEVMGPETPRWMRIEAMCQEWLSSFSMCDSWMEAKRFKAEKIPPEKLEPRFSDPIVVPREPSDDPVALDRHARKLMKLRIERKMELGRLLVKIQDRRHFAKLGYRCFEDYCVAGLGITVSRAYSRMALERKLCTFPELREAVASGRLCLLKAEIVARQATVFDIDARIEQAASTTSQETESDATAEEDLQNRAHGVRRLWGPVDAAETIIGTIEELQTQRARCGCCCPGRGEALALISDYFMAVWTLHRAAAAASKKRKAVLGRCKGLCAVPGCSRRAEHAHHVIYKSRGGSNNIENLVGLCALHHLRGIHGGFLSVYGNAEGELIWTFHVSGDVWATTPDGRARRVGKVAPSMYG